MRYKFSNAKFQFTSAAAAAALAAAGAAPAPDAPTKADIDVTLKPISDDILPVSIPAYDLSSCNRLCEVRAYMYKASDTPPTDAAGFVASKLPFATADASALQTGGDVQLQLPQLDPEPYNGAIVLGFES